MKELYKKLMQNGWTLKEVDEMDIHFYLDLYTENEVYIDEANVL